MTGPLQWLGKKFVYGLERFGAFWVFCGQTLAWVFAGAASARNWRLVMPQMFEIGVRSVPVVMATGLFVGMVLAVNAYAQFKSIGLVTRLGSIVNVSVVKELGCVLAGIMLAGRVGGALTAELGTMRVTEQIDALRSMGADPIRYLVVPRFLACFLLIPFLTAYADLMGIFGGYLISVGAFRLDPSLYWLHSAHYVEFYDVFTGLFKSLFFGAAIALICCFKGFTCRAGAQGVGRACTEGFVAANIAILVLDFLLAVLLRVVHDAFWVAKTLL